MCSNSLDDQVGRQLDSNIRRIEDGERDGVLTTSQTQILLQAGYFSVAQVGFVEEAG